MAIELDGQYLSARRASLFAFALVLVVGMGAPVSTRAASPDCAADRTPPVAVLQSPTASAVLTDATVRLRADVSDASTGVARVRFQADALDGSARFASERTAPPYEVEWTVPKGCGKRFAVAVDAADGCGNLVSPPSVFVIVDTDCPQRSGR